MTKPGVFYNLSELRAGDLIYVLNDKGVTTEFVVRESRNYDPAADATDVFTSKDVGIHLNLITCEGTWNPGQLSYSQRLVIFTDLAE
jgi:sortase (surface protein transpeptidase)